MPRGVYNRKLAKYNPKQGFQKVLNTVDGQRVCSKCGTKRIIDEFVPRVGTDYRGICRTCHNTRTRFKWAETRKRIFDYYGWECKCCGETIKAFLCLDHVNNDGYVDKHPGGGKKSGKALYVLAEKQGYPDKYQTLCMNCNWAKKVLGVCPHKTK